MSVKSNCTKDIRYSGTISVDNEVVVVVDSTVNYDSPTTPIINRFISNGEKYRANKEAIDAEINKFESKIWAEFDSEVQEIAQESDTI